MVELRIDSRLVSYLSESDKVVVIIVLIYSLLTEDTVTQTSALEGP